MAAAAVGPVGAETAARGGSGKKTFMRTDRLAMRLGSSFLPSFMISENDCDKTPWMMGAQEKAGHYKGLVRVQPPHYYPHPHLPLPFHRIIHLASRPNNRAPT